MDSTPTREGFVRADSPIEHRSQDRLHRGRFANAIADQAIHGPSGLGLVVGIAGKWGSGKTSLLKMIEESVSERSETVIVSFNPWLFSSTEQLVGRFLEELGAQLRAKAKGNPAGELLTRAGDQLSSYAEAVEPLGWLPIVGPWLARAGYAGRAYSSIRAARRKQPTAEAQREAVSAELRQLKQRVLVVIDDLDRVDATAIRDMVRLVKLVGDFPNTTYLLAYDPGPVERALGESPAEGREYLEKIVQVIHHVPEPPAEALLRLLTDELGPLIDSLPTGPFHGQDWQNMLPDGISPFFTTARDVRRYLNAIPVTLRVVGGEIALVDVLALETIRIFARGAYDELPSSIATLTGRRRVAGAARDAFDRDDAERVEAILQASGEHVEEVKVLLRWLFPNVAPHLGRSRTSGFEQEARRRLRVADADILRTYLERTLPEGVTSGALVGEAVSVLGDREELRALFKALEPDAAEGLIKRLEDYEFEFDPLAVEPALPVVLNQLSRLREGRTGMFDGGSRLAVTRLALRLLRRIEEQVDRLGVVERTLPAIVTLTGRMVLADIVGHREHVGHALIPEESAAGLYATVQAEVMDASTQRLSDEPGLFDLFLRITQDQPEHGVGWIRVACADDQVLLRLLRSRLGEQRSQNIGEYAVRTQPSLPWELLESWLGAAELRSRVEHLATLDRTGWDDRTVAALRAAEDYVSGKLSNKDI